MLKLCAYSWRAQDRAAKTVILLEREGEGKRERGRERDLYTIYIYIYIYDC